MLPRIVLYFIAAVAALTLGLVASIAMLAFVYGPTAINDAGVRAFAQDYLYCLPFIAALIAVPNALRRARKQNDAGD
jgi:hypothetical protein